jgi:hypothetical protein
MADQKKAIAPSVSVFAKRLRSVSLQVAAFQLEKLTLLSQINKSKQKLQSEFGELKGSTRRSQTTNLQLNQNVLDAAHKRISELDAKYLGLGPQGWLYRELQNASNTHPLFGRWLSQSLLIYQFTAFNFVLSRLKTKNPDFFKEALLNYPKEDDDNQIWFLSDELAFLQTEFNRYKSEIYKGKSIRYVFCYMETNGELKSVTFDSDPFVKNDFVTFLQNHASQIYAVLVSTEIEGADEDSYYETIYPMQDSIAFAIDVPPSDLIVTQLLKLTQENMNPDWYALLYKPSDDSKATLWRTFADGTNIVSPCDHKLINDMKKTESQVIIAQLRYVPGQEYMGLLEGLGTTNEAFIRFPLVYESTSVVNLIGLLTKNANAQHAKQQEKEQESSVQQAIVSSGLAQNVLSIKNENVQIAVFWAVVPLITATIWSGVNYPKGAIVEYRGKFYERLDSPADGKEPGSANSTSWGALAKPFVLEIMPFFLVMDTEENMALITLMSPFRDVSIHPCLQVAFYPDDEGKRECVHEIKYHKETVWAAYRSRHTLATKLRMHINFVAAGTRCRNLVLTPNVPLGTILVNCAKLFADIVDVDIVDLSDAARKSCAGAPARSFSLALFTNLKEDKSWYQKFGFVPCLGPISKKVIQLLKTLQWDAFFKVWMQVMENDPDVSLLEALQNINAIRNCIAPSKPITVAQVLVKAMETICISTSYFLEQISNGSKYFKQVLKAGNYGINYYYLTFDSSSYWWRRLTAKETALLSDQPKSQNVGVKTLKHLF